MHNYIYICIIYIYMYNIYMYIYIYIIGRYTPQVQDISEIYNFRMNLSDGHRPVPPKSGALWGWVFYTPKRYCRGESL